MIAYHEGCLKLVNFNIEEKTLHRKVKDKKTEPYKKKRCNDIFTFDIEVTSAWLEDGHVIGYRKNMPEEYWNSLEPVSLCYIWMFGINDQVYYGRELEEFKTLLNELPEMEAVCYIHNLSYEFSFLQGVLPVKSVFAKSPHKPMKCVFKDFPLIEFRCSYMLENLSLENWGKEIGVEKKTGDLDYLKEIRTPLTKLSKKEMEYCEYDIKVLYAGIKKEVERYGSLYNIPLTSTGKIRRVVKELLYNIPDYARYIKRLVPSIDIYVLLRELFAGGYTHASRLYAGLVIRGIIEHRDFASSYPFQMCARKYPCTPWTYRTERYIPKDKYFEDYAFIFKLRFKNIEATTINTYIQKSKCYDIKGAVKDNGRIVYAEELSITINEIDWQIIKSHYKWESVTLLDSWYSHKDYLPKEFILYVLELFGNKTSFKDVEGKEEIYNLSKTFINACFGMMVSDIVQADVKFDGHGWYVEFLQPETVDRKLKALSNRYHTGDKRYFLNYSWGCWVTAYGRESLWRCMDLCTDDPKSPGKDALYMDTDSIFGKGIHDYSSYDNWAVKQLEKMCKHYNIDPELTRPKNPKGKVCQLGIFEDEEDNITEFCALHAKCYVFRGKTKKDKKECLHLTVAGINKGAVDVLQDDIENFENGLCFDKDHESVKKNMHTYIIDQPEIVWPDGYISHISTGINIRPTGYTIKGNDEYTRLLEAVQNLYYDDINDIYINKLKGYFEYDGQETIL